MVIKIKKVLHFLSNISKGVLFTIILFLLSFFCLSIKLANENKENPYCILLNNNDEIILNYDEIITYDYYFSCSTIYFNLKVDASLSKNEIISLLVLIGKQLKDYDCFTHFEITSDSLSKVFYATINLKTCEISYV